MSAPTFSQPQTCGGQGTPAPASIGSPLLRTGATTELGLLMAGEGKAASREPDRLDNSEV